MFLYRGCHTIGVYSQVQAGAHRGSPSRNGSDVARHAWQNHSSSSSAVSGTSGHGTASTYCAELARLHWQEVLLGRQVAKTVSGVLHKMREATPQFGTQAAITVIRLLYWMENPRRKLCRSKVQNKTAHLNDISIAGLVTLSCAPVIFNVERAVCQRDRAVRGAPQKHLHKHKRRQATTSAHEHCSAWAQWQVKVTVSLKRISPFKHCH